MLAIVHDTVQLDEVLGRGEDAELVFQLLVADDIDHARDIQIAIDQVKDCQQHQTQQVGNDTLRHKPFIADGDE